MRVEIRWSFQWLRRLDRSQRNGRVIEDETEDFYARLSIGKPEFLVNNFLALFVKFGFLEASLRG